MHRWLALGLVVVLAVWSITGLLFHWKPGWDRAYDTLTVDRGEPLPALAPLAELARGDVRRVELFSTAIGPVARLTGATTRLVDAASGAPRSPLSEAHARVLVADAVARSPHAYGSLERVTASDATFRFVYTHATIDLRRDDARIAQRGADTARIDWLYRMHYLQWTGNRAIDRVLALIGLMLIWAVTVPGLVLFVRRYRRRVR